MKFRHADIVNVFDLTVKFKLKLVEMNLHRYILNYHSFQKVKSLQNLKKLQTNKRC